MFLLPAALVGTGVSLLPAIVTSTFASYVLVGIDEIGLESKLSFLANVENYLIGFQYGI
jgi:hypothetical protein